MIIKNFEQLASTPLRSIALSIAEAGYESVKTSSAVRSGITFNSDTQTLSVLGQNFNLSGFKRVLCVGFGKAALEAVAELQKVLLGRISAGYVIDLKDGSLGNSIISRVGTHPYPTAINVQATKELVAMLDAATEDDFVICVVSGGGSALLCYPHDLTCEAETSVIAALTAKGASIQKLNTVRKHISEVKGGHLAKIIYPATCLSLIFSDVPGDDLSMVASGPTVKDTSTNKDAAEILHEYDVLEVCQMPACRLLETPKEDIYFEKVDNILFVSAQTALVAMQKKAGELGFSVKLYSQAFQGIASELGLEIVSKIKPNECWLGIGESTVKIIGTGMGGRNQEMALSALAAMPDNCVLVTAASDGHDNTPAAGALADLWTAQKADSLGLDLSAYLRNNDSYNFFRQTGDFLQTGLTGINISDFFVCLRQPKK